jgi:hypothetical protein
MSVRRRRPDAAAMTSGDLLLQMINGLSLGAMYALLALGFTSGATHEIGAADQPACGTGFYWKTRNFPSYQQQLLI